MARLPLKPCWKLWHYSTALILFQPVPNQAQLPPDAPTAFVKARWSEHVFKDGQLNRAYYELCVLAELRSGLRSGDLWVVGSRQYKALEEHLLPKNIWHEMRQSGNVPVAVKPDFTAYLEERQSLLHQQLTTVDELLAQDKLEEVRVVKDELKISPLHRLAPVEAEALSQRLYQVVPLVKLTELVEEVEGWTNFSRHFTDQRSGESTPDKAGLLSVILADGINLGLSKMSQACAGVTFRQLG